MIPVPIPANLLGALNPLEKNESSGALIVARTKPFDIKFMPTKKQPHAVRTSIIANNVLKIGDINNPL